MRNEVPLIFGSFDGEWTFGGRADKKGPFAVTPEKAKRHLSIELAKIGARDAMVLMLVPRGSIRNDGELYANAKVHDPLILLRFRHPKQGQIQMPCRMFQKWIDNLRAIGLTMERLRLAEKYDCLPNSEQYAGLKGLPPGGGGMSTTAHAMPAAMTREQVAQEFVRMAEAVVGVIPFYDRNGLFADLVAGNPSTIADIWKSALHGIHPDQGGTDNAFAKFSRLRDRLRSGR